MGDTPEEIESIRRVRRGCFGIAILLTATAIMFIFSTGNLAWSLLLIAPILIVVLTRWVK